MTTHYIGVGRLTDGVIIAQYVPFLEQSHEDFSRKMRGFLMSKTVPIPSLLRDDVAGKEAWVYLFEDGQRLFVSIVAETDNTMNLLIREFAKEFVDKFGDGTLTCESNGLTSPVKGMAKRLCSRFASVATARDRIPRLNDTLQEVIGIASRNVELAMQRGEHAERLLQQTSDIHAQAEQFRIADRKIRYHVCRQSTYVLCL